MIDFSEVPAGVTRLATACLLQHVSCDQLLAMTPADSLAFAEQAGISGDDCVACFLWLGDYFTAHADALAKYDAIRARTEGHA